MLQGCQVEAVLVVAGLETVVLVAAGTTVLEEEAEAEDEAVDEEEVTGPRNTHDTYFGSVS